MDVLVRSALSIAVALALTGCQAPYLIKSAWSQGDLLLSRQSIDKALKSEKLTEEDRRKLELAREAKAFGERVLGLKKNSNYDSFVQLDRPFVSYVVSAAEIDRLEQHLWSFPIVGDAPYKGFFNPKEAEEEAEVLRKKGLDTFIRGVSAYSTLGWFDDPVLSSMLRYSDYDLVNTIIHESVHATLYIKSQADFNERLATFIGNVGADLFFQEKEGAASKTVAAAKQEGLDEKLFSEFISREIDSLKTWYANQATKRDDTVRGHAAFLEARIARLSEILKRFTADVRPKMQSEAYARILEKQLTVPHLNNARLLAWKLYVYDLADFERVYASLGRDPRKLIEFAKSLEKEKDPESILKNFGASK